jgi:hypothetical protein
MENILPDRGIIPTIFQNDEKHRSSTISDTYYFKGVSGKMKNIVPASWILVLLSGRMKNIEKHPSIRSLNSAFKSVLAFFETVSHFRTITVHFIHCF